MSSKLLVVSEGAKAPSELMAVLKDNSWAVEAVRLRDARKAVRTMQPDCVVFAVDDAARAEIAGTVAVLKGYDESLPLIAVAKTASLESAVDVMRAGAVDFVTMPVERERLVKSVAHSVRVYGLSKQVFLLKRRVELSTGIDEMVGQSPVMHDVYGAIKMVARSDASVLVLGESGTGKELVAKAIHRLSPRNKKRFIDINCGAIPRELLENELFGHERGAYTGADQQYIGSCERADGGTLFLDEISEMDPSLQVKLLRFLQERSFTRVGGVELIDVDVRVVAATNRDLEKEVKAGRFREDLYYRLHVVPILMPPLRDREEDVSILAAHFLEKYATKYERVFHEFTNEALNALASYSWPGNVRELENIIERVVVLYDDASVRLEHLPEHVRDARVPAGNLQMKEQLVPTEMQHIIPLKLVERYAIEAALARCLGNVAEAAQKLKISQATLYRKIKQYDLKI